MAKEVTVGTVGADAPPEGGKERFSARVLTCRQCGFSEEYKTRFVGDVEETPPDVREIRNYHFNRTGHHSFRITTPKDERAGVADLAAS